MWQSQIGARARSQVYRARLGAIQEGYWSVSSNYPLYSPLTQSMSKQAAAFQVAAKAALSRQPAARKHQTTLPSRRSGVPDNQIFTIVHPDWDSQPWTEPGITWRPSAATSRSKPPRDNITSAGDYVAYDYHKELAKVRSMRVDDLKAFLRQEKRWQAELQQLSLAALSSPSGVGEVLPSFEACRGLP